MTAESKKSNALFNSQIIRSYLGYVQKNYPRIAIDSVLAAAAMDRHTVEDPAHWFSQEATDRFVQELISRTRNPRLPRQVGHRRERSRLTQAIYLGSHRSGNSLADAGKDLSPDEPGSHPSDQKVGTAPNRDRLKTQTRRHRKVLPM